jgi:hypothetical protein
MKIVKWEDRSCEAVRKNKSVSTAYPISIFLAGCDDDEQFDYSAIRLKPNAEPVLERNMN